MATSFPSYLRGQVLRERSQEQLEECVRARIGPGGAGALRTALQHKAPGFGNSETQGSREAGPSDLQLTLARVASVSLGSHSYTQVHLPRGLCPGEGDSPTAAVLRDQLLLCEAGLQGRRRLL